MDRGERNGFTLIEILLVVCLLITIATFSLPAWRMLLINVAAERELARLTSAIQAAQTNAIKEIRPWRVSLDSDGGGFRLEYQTNTALDPGPCGPTGWAVAKTERFTQEVRLSVGTTSRLCFPFGPIGRPIWPFPGVVAAQSTRPTDKNKMTLLIDGQILGNGSRLPADPERSDAPLTVFPRDAGTTTSTILFDLQEVRYLTSPCLGIYFNTVGANAYPSPTTVRIQVSDETVYSSAIVWDMDEDVPIAAPPSNGPGVTCIPLEIGRQARWVRLTLETVTDITNPLLVVHEFDLTPVFLDLDETRTGDSGTPIPAKRIKIDSATGRITNVPVRIITETSP